MQIQKGPVRLNSLYDARAKTVLWCYTCYFTQMISWCMIWLRNLERKRSCSALFSSVFRFAHLTPIQHGDSYEIYQQQQKSGQKTLDTWIQTLCWLVWPVPGRAAAVLAIHVCTFQAPALWGLRDRPFIFRVVRGRDFVSCVHLALLQKELILTLRVWGLEKYLGSARRQLSQAPGFQTGQPCGCSFGSPTKR